MSDRCSEFFENLFDSHLGSCVKTCCCGRVYFNPDCGMGGWEEGELEELYTKAKEDPDKYREVDCPVGCMTINGQDVVHNCPCGTAVRYEKFLVRHARQVATYLNKRAELLRQEADAITVGKRPESGS